MNKWPERKYNDIAQLLGDGDLDPKIRTSVELVYQHMTQDNNKYALKQCVDMVNFYINKGAKNDIKIN